MRRERHFQFICLARDRIQLKEVKDQRARVRAAEAKRVEERQRRHAGVYWTSDEEMMRSRAEQWALEEDEEHNKNRVRTMRGRPIIVEEITMDLIKNFDTRAAATDEAMLMVAGRDDDMLMVAGRDGDMLLVAGREAEADVAYVEDANIPDIVMIDTSPVKPTVDSGVAVE